METLKLMAQLWPLLFGVVCAIGAGAVALYQIRQHNSKIEDMDKKITAIADVDKVIRARLYTKDGMTIFQPRAACIDCREVCQKQMQKSFDGIKELMRIRFDGLEALVKK